MAIPLPVFKEFNNGEDLEKGRMYVGFSDLEERLRLGEEPSLYLWTGTQFQHHTGWYDNGITHYIALDIKVDIEDEPA